METNHSDFVNVLLEMGVTVYSLPDNTSTVMLISFDNASSLGAAKTTLSNKTSSRISGSKHPCKKMSKSQSLDNSQSTINKKNSDGETALLHLLQYRVNMSLEDLTWLLELGADVNSPGRFGQTPLMAAISSRKLQVVQTLLKAGADPNEPDLYGRTPLLKVLEHSGCDFAKEAVDSLLNHGALVKSELHFAITRRLHGVFDILIESGGAMPRLEYNFSNKVSHVDSGVPALLKATPLSPVLTAFLMNELDLAQRLIRLDFLNSVDLYPSPIVLKTLVRYLDNKGYTETADVLRKTYSQPWSLWTLSFVKVSEMSGFGVDRKKRLDHTGLPRPLTQLLCYKDWLN